MLYVKVCPHMTVFVADHRSLLAAWKAYGGPLTLVSHFIVKKPLTAAQMRRLPGPLRARLEGPGASVERLERLFNLPDLRANAGETGLHRC